VRNVILIAFTMLAFPILSLIRTVGHDGIGEQFYNIQDAINASSHGDTIIVYPGTYYENINYMGRNVTIGSFELTTGNSAYRDSTIIDGNYNGSCINLVSNENNASIFGFTIQHGSGRPFPSSGATLTAGGGICVINATNFSITNCLIKDNKSSQGGGVNVQWGSVIMQGTIVRDNYASMHGGGIDVEVSELSFDSLNRCSVYNNYAGFTNDIMCTDTHMMINIYLNIATLNPTTDYYIRYIRNSQNYTEGFGIIDIQTSYKTEENHDIYLAPDGNDTNDGLSPATPRKSIANALLTIVSDSLNQKSIYLAPGIYSSQDGQVFPLNLKTYVNLIGDSTSPPTIANLSYEQTISAGLVQNAQISNLILEHGNHNPVNTFIISSAQDFLLSNITFNPTTAISYAGLQVYGSTCDIEGIRLEGLSSLCNSGIAFEDSDGSIRNCSINDCHNTGGIDYFMFNIFDADSDSLLVIENLSVTNCTDSFYDASIFSISFTYSDNPQIRMSNVLVANNTTIQQAPIIIQGINSIPMVITNCSFVNNQSSSLSALKIGGNLEVSNCIFKHNTQHEIYVRTILGNSSDISFTNNLIRGYPNTVYITPNNQVTFNGHNFAADPGFVGTDWSDVLSYRLGNDSPCIDAGTPDTTGLYLPENDLYGNPRIYNNIIDIGCNEWNGTGIDDACIPDFLESDLLIYPNPFIQETTLRYSIYKDTNVKISIFNIKGQLVKTLLNSKMKSGTFSTGWNGTDSHNKTVTSGVYFLTIEADNNKIIKKLLLSK